MTQVITDETGALRLARALAVDLSLYHTLAIEQGLRAGRPLLDLEDELLEVRSLYLRRVAAGLDPVDLLRRAMQVHLERWAASQGLPTAGLAEALARLAQGGDRLALQGGDGACIPLGDGVQDLGRVPPADIRLALDSVSRRHARIVVDGGRVTVEDLESSGGTFVNDERVRSGPLLVGDRLRLGGVTLTLIRVAAVESAQDPPQAGHDRPRVPARGAVLDELAAALAAGRGPRVLARCEAQGLEVHDPALREELLAALALRLAVRAPAQQGRWLGRHGEALLVLLPGPDAALREQAAALRAAVEGEPIATREGPIQVRLAIGVTPIADAPAPEPAALLERATAACTLARQREGIAIA